MLELAYYGGLTQTEIADWTGLPLEGMPPARQADGWIAWSPARHQGFLVVHNLPTPPAGKCQLWVIEGGRPATAGVFDVDHLGHASVVVPVDSARPDSFAITLEPAGGRPMPSGPLLMTSARPG